jgi:hypothetical protein
MNEAPPGEMRPQIFHSTVRALRLRQAAIALGLAATLSCLSTEASALIERSCTGELFVGIAEIDGQKGPGTNGLYQDGVSIVQFTGKGGCGLTRKNDCRRRAKEQIFSCLRSHFANRTDQTRPAECSDRNIDGYTLDDLTAALVRQACQELPGLGDYSGYHTVGLEIIGTTTGDEGCGREGQTDYISHKQYENVYLGFVRVACGTKLSPQTTPPLGYDVPRTRQPQLQFPKKK